MHIWAFSIWMDLNIIPGSFLFSRRHQQDSGIVFYLLFSWFELYLDFLGPNLAPDTSQEFALWWMGEPKRDPL